MVIKYKLLLSKLVNLKSIIQHLFDISKETYPLKTFPVQVQAVFFELFVSR